MRKTKHEIFLYEAAQYAGFEPKIIKTDLANFSTIKISSITTLYIPPSSKAPCNEKIITALGINKDDLQ